MKLHLTLLCISLAASPAWSQDSPNPGQTADKPIPVLYKEQECVSQELSKVAFGSLPPQARDIQFALDKCITLSTSPKLLKEVVKLRLTQRAIDEIQMQRLKDKVGKEVAVITVLTFNLCQTGLYSQGCEIFGK